MRKYVATAPRIFVTAIVLGLVGFPLARLVQRGSEGFTSSVDRLSALPGIGKSIGNTLVLGVGSTILALVVGILLSIALAELPPRLQSVGLGLCVVPILLPVLAAVVGWTFIMSPTIGYGNSLLREVLPGDAREGPFDVYSLPWIVLLTGVYLVPYVVIFVYSALRESDPALGDAARVAGAGRIASWVRIRLTGVTPAIVYSGGIVLLLSLGQFTAPLLLGRRQGIDVVTTEMFRLTSIAPSDFGAATVLGLPLLVLAVALVIAQGGIVGSLGRFAGTGKGVGQTRTGHKRALLPVLAYVAITIVPPIAGVVIVSLQPYWSSDIRLGDFTLDNYRTVLDQGTLGASLRTTLTATLTATVGTLILSVAVGLILIWRRGGRIAAISDRVLDFAVSLPLAVPPIIFGMGVLMSWGLGVDLFYGTTWMFVIAYMIVLLPLGARLVVSGLSAHRADLSGAARIAGASWFGSFVHITLPLLRTTLVNAAALMFLVASHEFSASALVRTPRLQPLTTRLYDAWETGTYGAVAVLALTIVVVSLGGLVAILGLGRVRLPRGRPVLRQP